MTLRISTRVVQYIDQRAEQEQLDRSTMMRLMLSYAAQKMPPGWRPTNRNTDEEA